MVPTGPVRMIAGHPLAFAAGWIPGSSRGLAGFGPAAPSLAAGPFAAIAGTARGPGLLSTGTQNSIAASTAIPAALQLTTGSLYFRAKINGAPSGNPTPIGVVYQSVTGSYLYCYALNYNKTSNLLYYAGNSSGTGFTNSISYAIPTTGEHSLGVAFAPSTGSLYGDGILLGTVGGATSTPSFVSANVVIGGDLYSGGRPINGVTICGYIFPRALSTLQFEELDAAPFSMLESAEPMGAFWWVGGGGGTLVTRDFSIPSLWAASIQRDEREALSWLTALQRDVKVVSAWAAAAVADQQARVDWTGALAADTVVPLSWLRNLTRDDQLPLNQKTNEQADALLTANWAGTSRADTSLATSWASMSQADASLLINWTGTTGTATGVDSRFGVAWASQILADGPAELAWLAKSQTDAQLSLATETKLLSDTQLSPASSTRLLSDSALPVSWTQTTYAMLGAGSFPLAWTAAVAADALAPLAWLGPSALFYGVDAQAFPRGIAAQSFARGISALPGQGTARR